MLRSATKISVLVAVAVLSAAWLRSAKASDNAKTSTREQAQAEVSSVTVDPEEVHQANQRHGPVATVTVQIAHASVATAQTVRVAVGTYSTNPPIGVAATYREPLRTVTIPASPQGVVSTSFAVDSVSVRGSPTATIIIFASLIDPSSGIRVVESPSPGNSRAALKVIGR